MCMECNIVRFDLIDLFIVFVTYVPYKCILREPFHRARALKTDGLHWTQNYSGFYRNIWKKK